MFTNVSERLQAFLWEPGVCGHSSTYSDSPDDRSIRQVINFVLGHTFIDLCMCVPLGSSLPPVIRHPGTCTFQRSQSACTFSLLCYLAGGTPVEGCGGDFSTTCCMLHSSHYSPPPFPPSPSPPMSSPSPPPFHSNPSPTHSRYVTSNSESHQSHDYPEPHPYSFGRTTPPTTEFIDYGFDNTIRRTRPDGHVKPFFREVSNRKVYARNLQDDSESNPFVIKIQIKFLNNKTIFETIWFTTGLTFKCFWRQIYLYFNPFITKNHLVFNTR